MIVIIGFLVFGSVVVLGLMFLAGFWLRWLDNGGYEPLELVVEDGVDA